MLNFFKSFSILILSDSVIVSEFFFTNGWDITIVISPFNVISSKFKWFISHLIISSYVNSLLFMAFHVILT